VEDNKDKVLDHPLRDFKVLKREEIDEGYMI
jgi:hypothetical protein